MTTNPSTHLFWITSRAAGTAALVLSSLAVSYGLMMGAKLLKRTGPDRRNIHEILSLSTMAAIAVHGLALLGDKYLHPSLADIALPFVSSYKTLATSAGIVAGWAIVLLGLSYYVRTRIGTRRWKMIHRFTLLALVLGLVHAVTEGTDSGQLWFLALTAIAIAPAVALLLVRAGKTRLGRRQGAKAPRTREYALQ